MEGEFRTCGDAYACRFRADNIATIVIEHAVVQLFAFGNVVMLVIAAHREQWVIVAQAFEHIGRPWASCHHQVFRAQAALVGIHLPFAVFLLHVVHLALFEFTARGDKIFRIGFHQSARIGHFPSVLPMNTAHEQTWVQIRFHFMHFLHVYQARLHTIGTRRFRFGNGFGIGFGGAVQLQPTCFVHQMLGMRRLHHLIMGFGAMLNQG